jgi:hypothetical protein
MDAQNATPPARFEVKAPAKASNVLIVLIDDMGFGQSSAFGEFINMLMVERLTQQHVARRNRQPCSPGAITRPRPEPRRRYETA